MKTKNKNVRKNAGFTLIELIVAVATTGGVLIALLLPAIQK